MRGTKTYFIAVFAPFQNQIPVTLRAMQPSTDQLGNRSTKHLLLILYEYTSGLYPMGTLRIRPPLPPRSTHTHPPGKNLILQLKHDSSVTIFEQKTTAAVGYLLQREDGTTAACQRSTCDVQMQDMVNPRCEWKPKKKKKAIHTLQTSTRATITIRKRSCWMQYVLNCNNRTPSPNVHYIPLN